MQGPWHWHCGASFWLPRARALFANVDYCHYCHTIHEESSRAAGDGQPAWMPCRSEGLFCRYSTWYRRVTDPPTFYAHPSLSPSIQKLKLPTVAAVEMEVSVYGDRCLPYRRYIPYRVQLTVTRRLFSLRILITSLRVQARIFLYFLYTPLLMIFVAILLIDKVVRHPRAVRKRPIIMEMHTLYSRKDTLKKMTAMKGKDHSEEHFSFEHR